MFEIEDSIPIPPVKSPRPSKYPFADMKPGQSIFFADITNTQEAGSRLTIARRCGGKWTSRSVDGGVRIWRVE